MAATADADSRRVTYLRGGRNVRALLRRRAAAGAFSVVGVEEALAQTDRFWRHLDKLVVGNIGDRLFKAHHDRWSQADRLVLRGGADIGELLSLCWVDLEVVVAAMRADDHAGVD